MRPATHGQLSGSRTTSTPMMATSTASAYGRSRVCLSVISVRTRRRDTTGPSPTGRTCSSSAALPHGFCGPAPVLRRCAHEAPEAHRVTPGHGIVRDLCVFYAGPLLREGTH
jgi:hypothetical protein